MVAKMKEDLPDTGVSTGGRAEPSNARGLQGEETNSPPFASAIPENIETTDDSEDASSPLRNREVQSQPHNNPAESWV